MMVPIWFVLGCLIDSISIILLTVPIFAPIAAAARLRSDRLRDHRHPGGRDRPADAAVRPPGVHRQGGGPRRDVPLGEIFRGSIPYWIVLLLVVVAIAVFPQIATFLPNLGMKAAG